MQTIGDLGRTFIRSIQQHLGTFNACDFAVIIEGTVRFFFKFAGEIIFRIPRHPSQLGNADFFFCVQFQIIHALLDPWRNGRVAAHLMHTMYEVVIHCVVGLGNLRQCLAVHNLLDVAIAHRVGGIRRQPSGDRCTHTERRQRNTRHLRLLQAVTHLNRYTIADTGRLFQYFFIVKVALPHHMHKRLFHHPCAVAVVFVPRLRCAGSCMPRQAHHGNLTARAALPGNAAAKHDDVIGEFIGSYNGK